jgi:hypothetical protein
LDARIVKALVSEMRFPIGPAGFRRLQDAGTTLLDLKGASGRVAATAPHEESGGHTALRVLVQNETERLRFRIIARKQERGDASASPARAGVLSRLPAAVEIRPSREPRPTGVGDRFTM